MQEKNGFPSRGRVREKAEFAGSLTPELEGREKSREHRERFPLHAPEKKSTRPGQSGPRIGEVTGRQ